MNELLSAVRRRKNHRGITTAAPYLRQLEQCLGGICPSRILENVTERQWRLAKKRAKGRLVYHTDGMAPDGSKYRAKSADEKAADGNPLPKHTIGTFPATITTTRQDRDGDVLETAGAELWPKAPFLYQHLPSELGGKLLKETKHTPKILMGDFALMDTKLGNDMAVMMEFGALAVSHGFLPITYDLLDEDEYEQAGFHVLTFKIVEVSGVSIPSNEDADIGLFSRNKLHHPLVKAVTGAKFKARPVQIAAGVDFKSLPAGSVIIGAGAEEVYVPTPGEIYGKALRDHAAGRCSCHVKPEPKAAQLVTKTPTGKPVERLSPSRRRDSDPLRWNKSLSEAFDSPAEDGFDVANEPLRPESLFYEWATRYIGVPVKKIHKSRHVIPTARMGSFLSAWPVETRQYEVEDIRNIDGGTESPPLYEMIQLNSTKSEDFLVDGSAFMKGPMKLIASFAPCYYGLILTLYGKLDDRKEIAQLVDRTWATSKRDFNFLKGEAFSLSGEFLPRADAKFEDVFLVPKNEKCLTRTVDLLNEKQEEFANRGIVFLGPPGTGKTLSGRIIKDKADATFIWLAARDFWYSGSMGGIGYAFDLAKELAPAVIFMEDVDNWLDGHAIDLLKTEMDGISRSKGILTILTTNYPEQFPAALIDRPGRFHDVLKFDVPDDDARGKMLDRWAGDLPEKFRSNIVAETKGWSGAHMYELAQFAKILQDQDGIELGESLTKAVDKIKEQRELISEAQLGGSHYRPRREVEAITKGLTMNISTKDKLLLPVIHGKSLDKAIAHCNTALDHGEATDELRKPVRAAQNLIKGVKDAMDTEEGQHVTTKTPADQPTGAGFLPTIHEKALMKSADHLTRVVVNDKAHADIQKACKSAHECVKSVLDANGSEMKGVNGLYLKEGRAFSAKNAKCIKSAMHAMGAVAHDDDAHDEVQGHALKGFKSLSDLWSSGGDDGTDLDENTADDGDRDSEEGVNTPRSVEPGRKEGRVVSASNASTLKEAQSYADLIAAHDSASSHDKVSAKHASAKIKSVLGEQGEADKTNDQQIDDDGDMSHVGGNPTGSAQASVQSLAKQAASTLRLALAHYGETGELAPLEALAEINPKAAQHLERIQKHLAAEIEDQALEDALSELAEAI